MLGAALSTNWRYARLEGGAVAYRWPTTYKLEAEIDKDDGKEEKTHICSCRTSLLGGFRVEQGTVYLTAPLTATGATGIKGSWWLQATINNASML